MMHHTIRSSAVAVLAVFLAGAAPVAGQADDSSSLEPRVGWDEFRKLYDAKKVEVIDVRSAEAYQAGHVPGARSVPLDEVEKHLDALRKPGKPLVMYCA